jgi:hypothetical protein
MITRACGFGIRVGNFSCLEREVQVLAMPDAGLDTMQRIESVCMVPLGASLLQLLVPGVSVGVIIDRRFVVVMMKATC